MSEKRLTRRRGGHYAAAVLDLEILDAIDDDAAYETSFSTYSDELLKLRDKHLTYGQYVSEKTAKPVPPTPGDKSKVRLPHLSLPKFSGKILEWEQFWDGFKAAVHDISETLIPGVQKFQHLRNQLEGDAKNCIAGLSLTAANYTAAIVLLKDRYGQIHKIVSAHLKELVDLQAPADSPSSFRTFRDSIESHIRSLDALELSLQQLRDFMSEELEIMNAGLDYTVDDSSELTDISSLPVFDNNQQNSSNKSTKNLKCGLCDKQHKVTDCNLNGKKVNSSINNVSQSNKSNDSTSNSVPSVGLGSPQPTDSGQPEIQSSKVDLPVKDVSQNFLSINKSSCSNVLLKTALAPVSNGSDNSFSHNANIMLDDGSQRTFITTQLAAQLKLSPIGKENLNVSTFGNTDYVSRECDLVKLHLQCVDKSYLSIRALVVPHITNPVFVAERTNINNIQSHGLKLAHPLTEPVGRFDISLLIGADQYYDIVTDEVIRFDDCNTVAVGSKLGFILAGPICSSTWDSTPSVMIVNTENQLLESFWSLENIGIHDKICPTKDVLSDYVDTGIQLRDGKYYAKFPWKDSHPELPTNRFIAEKLTRSTVRRLGKKPDLLAKYHEIMMDQLSRDFIELVDLDKPVSDKEHYIAHHCVFRDSATTPIRVVFNCSCCSGKDKPCLNDCLESGPPLLNNITSILLRFRSGYYGFTSDIEKAFLNIALEEEDRDSTRFFWLSDPTDVESDFVVYRFKSVLFASRSIMSDGGFNIRSWSSNCDDVTRLADSDGVLEKSTEVSVLGLRWNTVSDMLSLNRKTVLQDSQDLVTKRNILHSSATMYDPLGFLSPLLITAKTLLQDIWRK
ncbi:uncharacterized protein LOC141908029 [Tubulanus polymorphus]|uniref:uncharacterized protein LOC141908029 n=1 Tax=Tubulanus polymorphus TaxID=672921 RepID=UPI003DA4BF91